MGALTAVCPSCLRTVGTKRTIELLLAVIGAVISVGITIPFWQSESASGGSLWPLPGLVLLDTGILGLAGLTAAMMDIEGRSHNWGLLTWGVVGSLFAVVILGAFSIGLLIFPAVLAFCIAGLLANARRRRGKKANVAVAVTMGVANFLLILAFAVLSLS